MGRLIDSGSEAGWALVLAGGDGVRLRPLTRQIVGDERPKQFCPILRGETPLRQTLRRAALAVAPEHVLTIVTRSHACWFEPLMARSPGQVIVQPENRGTGPAILYGLLRLSVEAPLSPVAILPSDHYLSDDAAFMGHVERALQAVLARPDLVILLGITPDSPEIGYGWIESGPPLAGVEVCDLFRVRRFWEKPSLPLARTLLARRCLWNSFVMVARVPALLSLIRAAMPEEWQAFAALHARLQTPGEDEAAETLYDELRTTSFSDQVLARRPSNLAVLPVTGVEWSDWGEPHRVLATLARKGVRPDWCESTRARPA